MKKRGNGPLFVKALICGKGKHIDAAQLAIGRFAHTALYGSDAIGFGRLPQHIEKSFRFAHRSNPACQRHLNVRSDGMLQARLLRQHRSQADHGSPIGAGAERYCDEAS